MDNREDIQALIEKTEHFVNAWEQALTFSTGKQCLRSIVGGGPVYSPRDMEASFSEVFSDDERFDDLQYALTMYGADGYDQVELMRDILKECRWAIRTLKGICVYLDCDQQIVAGNRF